MIDMIVFIETPKTHDALRASLRKNQELLRNWFDPCTIFLRQLQLLPFPMYANVCLSSIGLSGGGIVMASQHGFKFQRISQWPSG